jgi:N-methylhydantoinase A/oxoprolinase/acetone carboxylase beta subunit
LDLLLHKQLCTTIRILQINANDNILESGFNLSPDTRDHVLACFGGAGGQHACAIARSLGMDTVYVHKYAGILSAYGMALADVIHEEQAPCVLKYDEVI